MSDCFFKQEILSAILLLSVLIRCKLIPRGESINNEQKKRASKRPILDLLQECSVQNNAEALSVMFSSTGWGSSVTLDVWKMWSAAQYLIVTNSRTLIDTNRLSLLLLLKSRVRWMISPGKRIHHKNPSTIEKPPAPSNELSPIVVVSGVRGMRWVIGVSHLMPELGLSLS